MPRKSLLLLLAVSFLVVATLTQAESIKNLSQLDSGQPFTLYGSDYSGEFVLTPNSIVHFTAHELHFAFSSPGGWEGGTVTYAFSFAGQPVTGEFNNVSPCSPPSSPCFGFGLSLGFGIHISSKTPASWTLSFLGPNGATETANFFVSTATPEPETLLLFGTGTLLVGVIYRCRMRSPGRIV